MKPEAPIVGDNVAVLCDRATILLGNSGCVPLRMQGLALSEPLTIQVCYLGE